MSTRTARLFSRLTAVAGALALGGMVLAMASPASAATRNGKCETGEFCYYFNSGNKGSVSDFTTSVGDYGTTQPSCYDFKGAGAGKGKCIKNEAASVWNRSGKTVRVYFNSNYKGSYQDFKPGGKGNLETGLKNQNASHRFLSSTPSTPTGCKTDGTHTKPPTTILVYRADLGIVQRIPFKTYVKNVLPNEWYASWPKESLKAGAIAAKNYGWYWALHSTRKTASGKCFDVWDHTNSQMYKPNSAQPATNAAVNATWGTRLTLGGKIFQAQYCQNTTACRTWWRDGEWMSQEGSRDKARAGWSYSRILKYYYKGIAFKS
ncbi:SpoIID/LytB domain protein [Actinocorallia herbida]|uniref:SpoIID/LytB domain protein n=1 Tax=Actinocorallia herbida TaxID=58109 RepID=A0A3N1DBT7_9ACTN|nr:SpoIID/LytB domain-containing protein [Actinocorallia herbida]ROO90578.1 SpoIID/LytB domain protein [Actinocorallia herbida]